MRYLNEEQEAHVRALGRAAPERRCWCGWDWRGSCVSCRADERLRELSLADRLATRCSECGNTADAPGRAVTHRVGCAVPEIVSDDSSPVDSCAET